MPVYVSNGNGSFRVSIWTGFVNAEPHGCGDAAHAYGADSGGQLDLLLSRGDRNDKHYSVLSTYWLFLNIQAAGGRSLIVAVGWSPRGGMSTGARVTVLMWGDRPVDETWTHTSGGAGEICSTSLLDTVHVGVGGVRSVASVRVRWLDRSVAVKRRVRTGGKLTMP